MRIAVLGWGSLIWDSRELNLPPAYWRHDGPLLPIEFARKSKNGRLTLVIYPGVKLVQVLWAEMHQIRLDDAIHILQKREGTVECNIGYLTANEHRTDFVVITDVLQTWRALHHYDALIWTDLKSNFGNYSAATVLEYLRTTKDKAACRIYINRAPIQIDTDMRRIIIKSGVLNDEN